MEQPRFGPAGTADSFRTLGYKNTLQVPEYLSQFGLTAFEYQCGRGVRVNPDTVAKLKAKAEEYGITLSLHAPYYISLSGIDPETREKSIGYILDSAKAAKAMGAKRVVVHSGSCSKISREEALELAKETLKKAQQTLDDHDLGDIILCPETMGKFNQLGTLEEVLELCRMEERFLPCIDFGHLNARTLGGMSTREDFAAALDLVENKLGRDRASRFHSHFSKIEYTPGGGEKRHLTFADTQYGPDCRPLMELIAQRGYHPTFICESAGTQTEDAAAMQAAYREYENGGV